MAHHIKEKACSLPLPIKNYCPLPKVVKIRYYKSCKYAHLKPRLVANYFMKSFPFYWSLSFFSLQFLSVLIIFYKSCVMQFYGDFKK